MKNSELPRKIGNILCFFMLITVFSVIDSVTCLAEMNLQAYSFKTLLNEAECVISGRVISVDMKMSGLRMTVNVNETLLGTATGTVIVMSPFYHGAFLEDQAYLNDDFSGVLFLKAENDGYTVVNGIAGVMNIKNIDDIRRVTEAYRTNPGLFNGKNMRACESLFNSIDNTDCKMRVLESINGMYTLSDESFLRDLLNSDETRIRNYAAVEAGYAGIASLLSDIEALCRSTSDSSVKGACLYSLAQYADQSSLPLILSFVNDADRSVRMNAVLAAGVTGAGEIADPLLALYDTETDCIMKLEIVTAIGRIDDKEMSKNILTTLKSRETDEIISGHLSFVINRLN